MPTPRNLTMRVFSENEREYEDNEIDAHVEKNGNQFIVDIFNARIENPNEAHIKSIEVEGDWSNVEEELRNWKL
jgi:hypothetical protein